MPSRISVGSGYRIRCYRVDRNIRCRYLLPASLLFSCRWDCDPDDTGKSVPVKRTGATLGYYPDNAEAGVSWSGVDSSEGTIAKISMDREDREIIASIGP